MSILNKSHLALAFGIASFGIAPAIARAQPHLGGPPRVTWPSPPSTGENTGGRGDRLDELAIESLRLGLTAGFVPFGRLEPGCGEHSEATGTATAGVPGYPLQHTNAIRLVPRLTLIGMSRAGCARDAAIGTGAVFVVPITAKASFVLGGGRILLPNYGPGGTAVERNQLRSDILFARSGGRSLSVGLSMDSGMEGGITRLAVGGIF